LPSQPILVTGATGFVGSAVARALRARGHTLRLLARPGGDRRNLAGLEAEVVEGDLTDAASLTRAVAGCRQLYHVAADYRLWVPDPAAMMAANVAGTEALLTEAARAGVERMVYCSSVAALGLTKDGTPADETTPVTPEAIIGPYKLSKYRAEQAALALAQLGLPIVIVNPSTPVGPRDIKPTPTGQMIADAASGRMPGYLNTGLNIVHVDDVAEGHVLACERGRIGQRYILGGEDFTMPALLALIDEVSGRPARRVRLSEAVLWPVALLSEALARATGNPPRVTRETLRMARKQMFFSSARARTELGYAPRPAREAIIDAVAWFRANGVIPRL
jgi:dihydroflavonol-4-reductase